MVGCAAIGCSNQTKQGFLMKIFPRNPGVRQRWIDQVNRANWEPTCNSRLCEVHFAPEMWEQHRADGKRKLKWNAVPTIFDYNKESFVKRRKPLSETTIPQPTSPEQCVTLYENIIPELTVPAQRVSLADTPQPIVPALNATLESQPSCSTSHQEQSIIHVVSSPSSSCSSPSSSSCSSPSAKSLSPLNTETHSQDILDRYEMTYKKLLRKSRKQAGQIQSLKRIIKRSSVKQDILKGVFNSDQILALHRNSPRFMKWSDDTITKAIKLKFACGNSGYQELLKQHIPLPSLRTLSRRLQGICFDSGVLHEIFTFLKLKVNNFHDDREKDCALLLNEMAITPENIYDTSLKKCFGSVTLPNHNGIATHALVIMIGGIAIRWKQTVAYYFTGDSVNGGTYQEILFEIIKEVEQLGLNVLSITSDKGSSDQALWKLWQITAGRHSKIRNYIPHPFRPERKIYVLADVPRLFKAIKSMLMNNASITLSDGVQKVNNLPTNIVAAQHIHELFHLCKENDLRLVPKLTEEYLAPTLFQKMKASRSSRVVSHDVSSGLRFLSKKLQRPEFETTAWFLDTVDKWFHLMTARHPVLALTKKKLEEYENAINFLETTMNTVLTMTVETEEIWNLSQTGLLVSTQSILDIQNELLGSKKYSFVLTDWFTQNSLEDLFSADRTKQSAPNAQQFTNNLKLITVTQYLKDVSKCSYVKDDGEFLGEF